MTTKRAMQGKVLICTVGTSLFEPNLSSISEDDEGRGALYRAYRDRNWELLAEELVKVDPKERICGAEINSMASMTEEGIIGDSGTLHLCHSDTPVGANIAQVLKLYYEKKGWFANIWKIEGLQDEDPRLFRTTGLRNLAKTISRIIRESGSPEFCAINATGGYKAQIAIAVLAGQAIGIPVYYKHERFPIIISLPPLPVALDFRYWLSKFGILLLIDREQIVAMADIEEDLDEKMESLIEKEDIDGKDYVELSPLGLIFLESFKNYFHESSGTLLPHDVPKSEKKRVSLSDHDWGRMRGQVKRILDNIVYTVPYVKEIHTNYLNPDLPSKSRFRLSSKGDIEGIMSLHGSTIKFTVLTSAADEAQREAVVADLNLRLDRQDFKIE